jgi:hypothetical protein
MSSDIEQLAFEWVRAAVNVSHDRWPESDLAEAKAAFTAAASAYRAKDRREPATGEPDGAAGAPKNDSPAEQAAREVSEPIAQAVEPDDTCVRSEGGHVQSRPAWYVMACAPLDGTLVRLLVRFDNHGIDDTDDPAITIGSCNDGEWNFAGWDWHRDEWTRGSGDLLGWLPIDPDARQCAQASHPAAPQPASAQVAEPVAWQEIETAPKDGTEILLTNGLVVHEGSWLHAEPYIRERRDLDGRYIDQDESEGFDGWMDWGGGMLPGPTHWMPLPAAPGAAPTAHPAARDALAAFGAWAARELRAYLSDLDGGDAQDAMVRCGVLVEHTATESCGEACRCVEYGEFPQQCLRYGPGVREAIDGAAPSVQPADREGEGL